MPDSFGETPTDRAGQAERTYGGYTLDELQALEAAATEEPWQNAWHAKVDSTEMIWSLAPGLDDNDVVSCTWYDGPRIAMLQADADFVCAARASLRFVLAALDAAEAERDKAKSALRIYGEHHDWCAFKDDTVSCSCGFDLALGGDEG